MSGSFRRRRSSLNSLRIAADDGHPRSGHRRRHKAKVDPVAVELVRNSLLAATEEMKSVLMRTSYNMIIYKALDFTVRTSATWRRCAATCAGATLRSGPHGTTTV